jgi:hypothetical protein
MAAATRVRGLACALRRVALALLLGLPLAAGASPFMDGTTADVWVVDPETGRVTGYDFSQWVESFVPAGAPLINLRGSERALVNSLPGSSEAPTPGQPAISLTGIGARALAGSADAARPVLLLDPPDGDYDGTIPVRMQVSAGLVTDEDVVLGWQVNGGAEQAVTLRRGDLSSGNTADGYYARMLYLVVDGDYQVSARLRNLSGTQLATAERNYRLRSSHPDGFRRDTDGDGIPDLVEAELGLDPFSDDWRADLDGDGWSRFDKWLRERCLDEGLVPIETGDPCVDEDGLPLDSDGDGWADFDERLRGTNPTDPEPLLSPRAGETPDSESFRERILRFKDYPAARRLYEAEHVVGGTLQPVTPEPWSDLVAATMLGADVFELQSLLDQAELDLVVLDGGRVADRLRRAVADAQLAANELPLLRLPAGDSVVVAAVQDASRGATLRSRVYKRWIPRRPDVTPRSFYEAEGAGAWTTAAEWRRDFIRFLARSLALPATLELGLASTEIVSVIEGALGEESRLEGGAALQVFAYPRAPIAADFVQRVEQALGRFADATAPLDVAATQIAAALAPGEPLNELSRWIRERIETPPADMRSDLYVAAQFQRSFDSSCYQTDEGLADLQADPAAWAAFLERCPTPLTEAQVNALFREDALRTYLARLFLLPGAGLETALEPSLLELFVDSDTDGLENRDELAAPLSLIALPWHADTDGDGMVDGSDPCPSDPWNQCSGDPVRPGLALDADVMVFEPGSGTGYALIGIELSREYDHPVTITYQAFVAAGDTATPGSDFIAVTGTVTIAPGQRVVIVRVPVLGDALTEDPETFSFRITSITGAVISGSNTVRVTINDTPPESGCGAEGCRVGVQVQGLLAGNLLGLRLNGGEELLLTADGQFFFPDGLADGSSFSVSISRQPPDPPQECFVQNGSGTIDGSGFPDVLVLCFRAVALQAQPSDAQVTLDWNATDFAGATFNLCRAEEAPVGGFANCLAYDGGEYFNGVTSPLAQSGLVNGRQYWFVLQVQHAPGPLSYSAVVSATPEQVTASASRLNDSGQRFCYGDSWTDCNEANAGDQAARPRQDGRFGRDAMAEAGLLDKIGGGNAGFDFTPLDAAGQPIAIVDGVPEFAPACVRDNVSGLVWEVKTPENGSRNFTRGGAFNYASTTNSQGGLCGFSDWRVPDRRELFSIVDNFSRFKAFDERFFPNTTPTTVAAATLYWTNEVYHANPTYGWTITFLTGASTEQLASSLQKVRLVRGERFPLGDFRDNGDGTVSDLTNGLTWDKCSWGQAWDSGANACSSVADAASTDWSGALTTAVTANEAGHRGRRDWRLPNRVELESLLRLNADLPAIDASVFPNTAAVGYWSSTPHAISLDAWRVAFDYGRVTNAQMTLGNRVRLVRSDNTFDLLAPIQSRLNDTGRTECFDGAGLGECIDVVAGDAGLFPQQDGRFGRDARALSGQLAKFGGGPAGFDFTPIDSNGEVIELAGGGPASAHACVQDNVTGLTWEVKTPGNAGTTYSWDAAETYAENLNNGGGLCGHSDWRIPTRRELLSILDHGRSRPATDTRFFPNTSTSLSSLHWTADDDLSAPLGARHWTIDFAFGDSSSGIESATSQLVRLVRGELLPEAMFRDNGDGTVTDMSTGLTWDKCAWGQSRDAAANQCGSPSEMSLISWGQALQVPVTANAQLHRGQSDWRLPNRTELESLFDLASTFPAMDTGGSPDGAFGNAPAGGIFWTSTIQTADFTGPTVWFGDFDFGDSAGATVSTFPPPVHGVRLVRGGDDFDALE